MTFVKKILCKEDLQPLENYVQHRDTYRLQIVELKKQRRLQVGPDVIFHFENSDTIRFQIQEMLYIEKGGAEQIEEELNAYNPLLPQGNTLTATMMIEIPDLEERKKKLLQLGHIENNVVLGLNDDQVFATSIDSVERTTAAGKTSAVHFLTFVLNEHQKNLFKQLSTCVVVLKITHPAYSHQVDFPKMLQTTLAKDLE